MDFGTFENLLLGESHGDFHSLYILRNGAHQEINDVLNGISGGGGGALTATLPLAISGGILSIDLSGYSNTSQVAALLTAALQSYIPTAHEANKIASADLVHGQYDIETKSVTL